MSTPNLTEEQKQKLREEFALPNIEQTTGIKIEYVKFKNRLAAFLLSILPVYIITAIIGEIIVDGSMFLPFTFTFTKHLFIL